MMRPRISEVVEERHSSSILIYLYLCGKKSKTEIYNAISTNPRLPYKLQHLEELGLITIDRDLTGKQQRSVVDLTPLGVTFAEGLCNLERRIGGNPENLRRDYYRSILYCEDES